MSRSEWIEMRLSLRQLLAAASEFEQAHRAQFHGIPKSHAESARNLAHYLAVRQHDLRPLQNQLSRFGLSSLGRMEGRVQSTLLVLEQLLSVLIDGGGTVEPLSDPYTSASVLEGRTRTILGPEPSKRRTRIMVTLPTEAAADPGLCAELLRAGMNAARINCAHDTPHEWAAMAANVRGAAREQGVECVVMCDLPGPKLRIGPIQPGPRVLKCKPRRDALGQVVEPARITLALDSSALPATCSNTPTLPVVGSRLIECAQPGDSIVFSDARGRKRVVSVVHAGAGHVVVQSDRTAYVTPGTVLHLRSQSAGEVDAVVGELEPTRASILVSPKDLITVKLGAIVGHGATAEGTAVVGCELAEVFAAVEVGDRVLFDDGKIEGVVSGKEEGSFAVEVHRAGNGQAKLSADKGINLPDTDLKLPALSAKDLEALDFAAAHADAVALSFVHSPEDIAQLQSELEHRNAGHLGKVLKIETRRAFERLPSLLFAGLKHPPLSVMVARGDLGVEIGFERLAEVQEEILWLCEAAHVPVIWATQVLESLTKQGWPSRAEVTDAAMSGRAEAVMLNKGAHICQSVQFLCNVLERMEDHQHKKSARLRKLSVSRM